MKTIYLTKVNNSKLTLNRFQFLARKKHTTLKSIILMFVLNLIFNLNSEAQVYINGNYNIHSSDTVSEISDEILIGPDAVIEISGVWIWAGKEVDIDPAASIRGTGKIIVDELSKYIVGSTMLTDAKVELNANNCPIDCKVELVNSMNMELKSNAYFKKELSLLADDAHIILGAFDLKMAESASISNFDENRYVVTSSSGKLIKEGLSGAFTFPIGATEGTLSTSNYTPAKLNNTGVKDQYSARVDETVSSTSSSGVNDVSREWEIEELVAGGSNVELTLQHNSASEESAFDNDHCYVSQYAGTAPNNLGPNTSSHEWDLDRSEISAGTATGTLTSGSALANASEQSRTFTDFSTNTLFTKLSDGMVCLSAKVLLQGPLLGTGSAIMQDSLRSKGLIPTTEPYTSLTGFTHYGNGGGETTTTAVLSTTGNDAVVDWVIVDLIDANNNQNIVESQSALLLRNGKIVSTTADEALCFSGLSSSTYYVGVRHRNHLPIQSSSTFTLTPSSPSFDFSTGSLYGTNSLVTINSVNAMWAGDANTDNSIIYSGTGEDGANILNAVNNHANNRFSSKTFTYQGYDSHDINMDGIVIFTGTKNDVDAIKNNVFNHPGNTFKSSTYSIGQTRP